MIQLLKKDCENARLSLGPALLLGLSLFLVIQFTQSEENSSSPLSIFWITWLVSLTGLYFRSFSLENKFQNFHFYTAFKIPRLKIFLSQTLVHWGMATFLGSITLGLTFLFLNASQLEGFKMMLLILLVGACLSPLGTVLGLMLQMEREFLFSMIFFPLATPIILGAYSLSLSFHSPWLWILLSFGMGGGFLSAFIFEFFFDELTQNL